MITVEEHLARVLAAVAPLPPRPVPLAEALGTVLAEDVPAALAVPPFDNSAMDGYAVRAGDVAGATPTRRCTCGWWATCRPAPPPATRWPPGRRSGS